MKKGESGKTTVVTSNMISLGPQAVSTNEKGKARMDKNLDARNNCVVMPIADGRLNAGLIPMYPLTLMPSFIQACKMGAPYPFPGLPGATMMNGSPSLVNMASFNLMREMEAQAGKSKEVLDAKNSSTNSSVRNTYGLPPTLVSHQIEMTSINLARTNSTSPNSAEHSSELLVDEETDSGSAISDQSSDSDFEDEERVLVRKWEKDRCDVAWKWSWLRLQVDNLKNKLSNCDKQVDHIRSKKRKLIVDHKEEDGDEQCARTCGFDPPKERKKVVIKESHPTFLDKTSHPVLKAKALKRKHSSLIEDEEDYRPSQSSYSRNSETPKRKRNPTPLRLHTPVGSPRMSNKNGKLGSPKVPTPLLGESPRTRRQRKRDEYHVDNFVIPFTGPPISPKVFKDIVTPSWTEISEINIEEALEKATEEEEKKTNPIEDDTPSETLYCEGSVPITTTIQVEDAPTNPSTGELMDCTSISSQNVSEGELKEVGNEHPKGFNEPTDDIKDPSSDNNFGLHVRLLTESKETEIESMSSDEDTSDEAFAQRHFCRELLERKRYLFPDKNKSLPATPDQLPTEFFVASLASPFKKKKKMTREEEAEKLKQKFEKIRTRYIESSKLYHSWEDLSHLARDNEKEVEDENEFISEWDSGCELDGEVVSECFDLWEIVQKPPLFDDQGRERNIVYLRRIQNPVAVVE